MKHFLLGICLTCSGALLSQIAPSMFNEAQETSFTFALILFWAGAMSWILLGKKQSS